MIYFILLSFLAGIAIVTQANLNAYLGQLLASSVIATFVALSTSAIFVLLVIFVYVKEIPSIDIIKSVPIYLWFTGGLLGAFALACFYYIIPKIGLLHMISYSLCGQLIISMLSSHYGWFNMPVSTISISKISGIILMTLGIFLINKG